jgi:4-hydroxy-tetrahydrodipicolinate synthase
MRRGSSVALITPFLPSGDIDVLGLEQLIQFHLDQGTDNLCILGTTAEAAVMTLDERALVLKTIVPMAKGKIPILVGTGTINPASVKAMTLQAMDYGADASLLVTPYYVKPPQRGLIRHFTEIADLGLPLVMYNVPGRTGVNLNDATVAICAQHEGIVGLKDATGDLSRIASVKAALSLSSLSLQDKKDFLLFSGDDESTVDFCLNGGDGCISVTANVAPNVMHRMVHAALRGDADQARLLNAPLASLHDKIFIESNPIPAKWAAQRLGLIDSAYCRPPLDSLDPALESIVEQALYVAGLLDEDMKSDLGIKVWESGRVKNTTDAVVS